MDANNVADILNFYALAVIEGNYENDELAQRFFSQNLKSTATKLIIGHHRSEIIEILCIKYKNKRFRWSKFTKLNNSRVNLLTNYKDVFRKISQRLQKNKSNDSNTSEIQRQNVMLLKAFMMLQILNYDFNKFRNMP